MEVGHQLVELLLEKETVDGEAVYRIAGKPVPGPRPANLEIAPHARSTARTAGGNGSDPALHADPQHRPGTGPATTGTA